MNPKDIGGAFFNSLGEVGGNGSNCMTLRDYAAIKFAAAAIAGGMIYGNDDDWLDDAFAKADAFIARREK